MNILKKISLQLTSFGGVLYFVIALIILATQTQVTLSQNSNSTRPLNYTEIVIKLFNKDGITSNTINLETLQNVINFGKNNTNIPYVIKKYEELHKIVRIRPWTNCLSAKKIFSNRNISEDSNIDYANLTELLPEILFTLVNPKCYHTIVERKPNISNPTTWLYSLLAVLIMKICSLAGIIAFPFMSETFYTKAIAFLVALAISSLLGGTLFFFIPDALSLKEVPNYVESHGEPIFYMICVAGGIYAFYLLEKLLRLLMEMKEKQYYKSQNMKVSRSATYNLQGAEESTVKSRKISVTMAGDVTSFQKKGVVPKSDSRLSIVGSDVEFEKAEEEIKIPPIAYIVIIGDCVRNFIDGIAIGAAFSLSTLTGVSLALAFLFEEIPTELGDVAILLSAGMSICRAAASHFGAAVFAFVGAAVGIMLGDVGKTQLWIFAFSAGFFLYIALVDLMPEMNHALDNPKSESVGRLQIFLLQNLGLILGVSITALLGYYSEYLHIDFGDGGGH